MQYTKLYTTEFAHEERSLSTEKAPVHAAAEDLNVAPISRLRDTKRDTKFMVKKLSCRCYIREKFLSDLKCVTLLLSVQPEEVNRKRPIKSVALRFK